MSDPDTAEAIPATRPLFAKPAAEPVEAVTGAPVTEPATTHEATPVDAAVTQEGIEANAAATLAQANADEAFDTYEDITHADADARMTETAEVTEDAVVEPTPEAEETAPEVDTEVVNENPVVEAGEPDLDTIVTADEAVAEPVNTDGVTDETAAAEVAEELAPAPVETKVDAPLAEPASVGSTASAGDLTAATSNTDGTTNGDLSDVEALEAQRDALDAQIKAQRDTEKNEVLTQIKTVMQSFGVTTEDVVVFMGDYKPKRTIAKAVPKYKDPLSGVTWSGRGKAPAWIKGQDYTKFLI